MMEGSNPFPIIKILAFIILFFAYLGRLTVRHEMRQVAKMTNFPVSIGAGIKMHTMFGEFVVFKMEEFADEVDAVSRWRKEASEYRSSNADLRGKNNMLIMENNELKKLLKEMEEKRQE